MPDFEKLGAFYLGRIYDPASRKTKPDLVLYDSKDLVTHAVCVGMTGSGKTGLSIGLIEEAAIDNIPAVLIDPKGDLGNLLLTFPALGAADFRPWIDEDEARAKGSTPEDFAAQQADLWRNGLGEWGQSPDRIRRLREAAEFCIYTPGSSAGRRISILRSFSAPPPEAADDPELMRDRVGSAAAGLLGLAGIDASPQSREHILLSTLLTRAWREGRDVDLAQLIQMVQSPPLERVGVLDVESFFPAKDRFSLAMALNNVLAAPGFEAWLEGDPLDIKSILYTQQGKPRISIFSIAHLNDQERMFFVTLLLNEVVGWMRSQPGTGSLRALVYMDEIFGYLPPVANPPSKQPLMVLLKQARAFGVGVVLATQNPVDLDYKALANAGTWFIGRLQTERDKARLLDGLEGAGSQNFHRAEIDEMLSSLGKRVFLLHNVHEEQPVLFQTRWTLSYLRGPLTRTQIKALSKVEEPAGEPLEPKPAAPRSSLPPSGASAAVPVVPPGVPQFFVAGSGVLQPMLLGIAQVRIADTRSRVDISRDVQYLSPFGGGAVPVNWDEGEAADLREEDLEPAPPGGASFAPLPAAAARAKNYAVWSRDFVTWLAANEKVQLLRSPATGLVSKPDEDERDFRARVQQVGREERDAAVEQIRRKYAPRMTALEERIRRAGQAVEREAQQASSQSLQSVVSIGSTLLGAFLGRKVLSGTNLSRAGGAVRTISRGVKERQDVARAQETVEALRAQLAELETQFKTEAAGLEARTAPAVEQLESIEIRPRKTNIAVRMVALAWVARTAGR